MSRGPARGRRRTAGVRGAAEAARPRETVVPLDAEDIAMARLQARLRQAEAIQGSRRPGGATLTQTTVRLPRETLRRVRERARRDGVTVSEVLEIALGRFLGTS